MKRNLVIFALLAALLAIAAAPPLYAAPSFSPLTAMTPSRTRRSGISRS